ncbi:MAG: hypothetical protein LBT44_05005 [Clostridiales bacterium]|nr:hypothetical protein [Clostridiales bacterium]
MERRVSRRTTPWDGDENMIPTQEFLKRYYDEHYTSRHENIETSVL